MRPYIVLTLLLAPSLAQADECPFDSEIDRDNCYGQLAVERQDVRYCSLIVGELAQSVCEAGVALSAGGGVCPSLESDIGRAECLAAQREGLVLEGQRQARQQAIDDEAARDEAALSQLESQRAALQALLLAEQEEMALLEEQLAEETRQ